MNVYFDFLLKASVSISIMYALYWLLLRNMTHFKANRFFLLASVLLAVICAAFPVRYEVLMTAPQVMQSSEFADQFQRNISSTITPQEEEVQFNMWNIGLAIYLLGLIMVLLRLIIQSWKPIQIIFKTKAKKIDEYLLHENTVYKMPFSFFNRILIHPEYFKQNEINDILAHEKVHIQERHWIDLFIIELLTVFFWFNPFIWLFERAIKQNHEYLADKGVLSRGQSPVRYQAILINQLMGTKVIGLANHLNFALGPTRFKMMTKEKTSKRKLYRMIWLLPVLAVLMYSFAQPEYKVQVQEEAKKESIAEVSIDDVTNVDPVNSELPLKVNTISKENAQPVKGISNSTPEKKVKTQGEGEKLIKSSKTKLRGVVKDNNGKPIEGASIILKGSNTGTITDAKGKYEFELPSEGEFGIIATHPGYEVVANTLTLNSTKGADWKHDFILKALNPEDTNEKQKVYKISGTVKSEDGKPMPGASIIVKGTTIGTVSDWDGNYEIEVKNVKKLTLIASFVGYRSILSMEDFKEGLNNVNFTMKREVIGISADELKKAGDMPPPPPPPPAPKMKTKKSDEPVFYIVEELPEYPQGFYGLAQHVKKQSARIKENFFFEGKKLKGNATVGFTITPKGEVSNIQILKQSNKVAAEAAQIIASKMEYWKPGSQRGKKVNVDFAMEINFE
ncbi:carboxypeptidase-like regulatory domain-containing protein [Marinifilum caeruleilacunae]|uniref:TonB C-terminal domain-containing protein n=1 Tax=Marinifilum caeruleilacunae TaxID=2499076 RepID=A0ABX1WSX8_9BACT|nr:carboxypeptidase-like regulatory domain-containing protein [Marinifilum caeruleilacunae]NOU59086.1 hypothetical protein [Marinifilum caeruleilacunae]